MPDVTQLSALGPTQNPNSDPAPTVAENGPPSGVIVTEPVSEVLRFTGLPNKPASIMPANAADGTAAIANFSFLIVVQ